MEKDNIVPEDLAGLLSAILNMSPPSPEEELAAYNEIVGELNATTHTDDRGRFSDILGALLDPLMSGAEVPEGGIKLTEQGMKNIEAHCRLDEEDGLRDADDDQPFEEFMQEARDKFLELGVMAPA